MFEYRVKILQKKVRLPKVFRNFIGVKDYDEVVLQAVVLEDNRKAVMIVKDNGRDLIVRNEDDNISG